MVVRRSRLSSDHENLPDGEPRPRLNLPIIPTLVGLLALVNIASAILALVD
jgi:hypothetical protein